MVYCEDVLPVHAPAAVLEKRAPAVLCRVVREGVPVRAALDATACTEVERREPEEHVQVRAGLGLLGRGHPERCIEGGATAQEGGEPDEVQRELDALRARERRRIAQG